MPWHKEVVPSFQRVGGNERLPGSSLRQSVRGGPAIDAAGNRGRSWLRRGRWLHDLWLGRQGAYAAEPPASQLAADVQDCEQWQEQDHERAGRANTEVAHPWLGQDGLQARDRVER